MSGLPVPEFLFSPVFWVAAIAGGTVVLLFTGWFMVKVLRAVWRGWR